MTRLRLLPLLGTAVCIDYAADFASYREKCKSKPSTAFCWMDDPGNADVPSLRRAPAWFPWERAAWARASTCASTVILKRGRRCPTR